MSDYAISEDNNITFYTTVLPGMTKDSARKSIKEVLLKYNYSVISININHIETNTYLVTNGIHQVVMADKEDVLLMKLKGHDKEIIDAINNPEEVDAEQRLLLNIMRNFIRNSDNGLHDE